MKKAPRRFYTQGTRSFTLVEILAALAVLLILMVLMATMVDQANIAWSKNKTRAAEYRDAGNAFNAVTSRLSQATLNIYWDYVDSSGNSRTATNSTTFVPHAYTRQSELRFISGPGVASSVSSNPRPTHAVFFQAPLGYTTNSATQGLENLLNTWGYYIEYGPNPQILPSFITSPVRTRFRLMEMMEPTDSLSLYKYTSGNPGYSGNNWFTDPLSSGADSHVLAENVIALILLPKLSPQEDSTGLALAPNYSYDSTTSGQAANTSANPTAGAQALVDSKNQLPPVVQVSLVTISEESAIHLGAAGSANLLAKINTLFSNAANLTSDLRAPPNGSANSLESYLIQNRISYRIFTTDVAIKAAKWSTSQTN